VTTSRKTILKGRRGALLCFLALAGLSFPVTAQKMPKVGVTPAGSPPDRFATGFRRGLAEHGWQEGKNIVVEYRYAGGRTDRYKGFREEFVRSGVDVIVSGGGTVAARVAMQTTQSIPIVVPIMADPVAAGLVTNLARPGGQITGLSLMIADWSGKRVELLREAFPKMRRIAALLDPSTDLGQRVTAERAAKQFAFELLVVSATHPDELQQAIEQATMGGAQGMVVFTSAMLNANRKRIVELIERNRLPAIYENREYLEVRGLMSYGPDLSEMYRVSAKYVDRILRGARPGDLPIEQPTKFELLVNLRAARALGVELPRSFLLRADQVVE